MSTTSSILAATTAAAKTTAKPKLTSGELFASLVGKIGQPKAAEAAQTSPTLQTSYKAGRLGMELNGKGQPSTVVYYDAKGNELDRSPFIPERMLALMNDFGIDKSELNTLADKLDAGGVKYKPGEMFAGASGAGVDLRNLAGGGFGTPFDWTKDANVALKGPYAMANLQLSNLIALQSGVGPYASPTS